MRVPAEYQRVRRLKMKTAGLCWSCSQSLDRPRKSLCKRCRKRANERQRNRSAGQKKKDAEYQRRRRARLKSEDRCHHCGGVIRAPALLGSCHRSHGLLGDGAPRAKIRSLCRICRESIRDCPTPYNCSTNVCLGWVLESRGLHRAKNGHVHRPLFLRGSPERAFAASLKSARYTVVLKR